MNIVIIGYLYSGEVELANFLEKKYFCSTLYLDEILPKSDATNEIKCKMVKEFMKENISWVIEGTYEDILLEERIEKADKIVIMKYNRFSCLFRYIRRQRKNKEKINKEDIKEIFINNRKSKYRKLFNNIMRKYSDRVVLIFNNAQNFMLKDMI